jgi:hypothetical protein
MRTTESIPAIRLPDAAISARRHSALAALVTVA